METAPHDSHEKPRASELLDAEPEGDDLADAQHVVLAGARWSLAETALRVFCIWGLIALVFASVYIGLGTPIQARVGPSSAMRGSITRDAPLEDYGASESAQAEKDPEKPFIHP
jgi:hypothetical protein